VIGDVLYMKSAKARKQRKRMFNATLNVKQKLVAAHLSKEMKTQLKKRSLPIRKGDEVKVLRGKFKGTSGKVTKVDLKRAEIFVDSIKRKRINGEETQVAIHPSNFVITNADMNDSKRIKKR
jgi:large subunit ribosomal protein L24